MKKVCVSLIILFLVFFVTTAGYCQEQKVRVYYGNGVLNDEYDSDKSLSVIQDLLQDKINGTELEGNIIYDTSHNPSDGLIDFVEYYTQNIGTDLSQFWRFLSGLDVMPDILQEEFTEISAQFDQAMVAAYPSIQEHVETYNGDLCKGDKVVVVAHSQGNLFANIAYPGINPNLLDSFGIVSVANPDSYVADSGPYTSLEEDIVISYLALFGALPPNLDNFFGFNLQDWSGHKFIESYLASGRPAETKIIDDIVTRINTLQWPEGQCSKDYLLISAEPYVLIWDIAGNKVAENIPLNNGSGYAQFPILTASISDWIAARTVIDSQSLYNETPVGQGGDYDGFSSSCFEEGWDERDCYDYTSFNGSGGCNKTGIDETISSLSFDYSLTYDDSNSNASSRTCSTISQRNTSIPFWNGISDFKQTPPDGYTGYINLIAPPSGGHGVTLDGSKRFQANNANVYNGYLQVSREQSVIVVTEADYNFLWSGVDGYYQDDIDVIDEITILDPWGINYSNTFERYVHRYADTRNWVGFFDVKNPYPAYEYNLTGIFSDFLIAQVRVIRIQEKISSCYTEDNVWYDPYWRGCTVETELTGTPVFDVMAGVYEFNDLETVNPFILERNTGLEQKISEMLGEEFSEISLMFAQ